MKLEKSKVKQLVNGGLGVFTDGAVFRGGKVYITLNLPDGNKTSIQGEWLHMSDSIRLTERIKMLQHAIYEQYPEYNDNIPCSWAK